jgi:hypothetical protein
MNKIGVFKFSTPFISRRFKKIVKSHSPSIGAFLIAELTTFQAVFQQFVGTIRQSTRKQ